MKSIFAHFIDHLVLFVIVPSDFGDVMMIFGGEIINKLSRVKRKTNKK